MKLRKLAFAWISLTSLVLSAFTFPSAASGETNPLLSIIPSDLYGFVEVNPLEVNSTLQDFYAMGIDYLVDESLIPYYSDDETNAALKSFYENLYENQTTSLGVTTDEISPAVFIFTPIAESDFNSLIELYGENIEALFLSDDEIVDEDEDIIKGEEIETTTAEIYQPVNFGDTYLMYHEGYFVLSSEIEFLEELDAGFDSTLEENEEYQTISNEFLSDNFLNVFMDFQSLLQGAGVEILSDIETESTVLDSFKSFGLSVDQNSKGFSIQEYVTLDEDVLNTLGIDYSDNADTPYLYELMPSTNPIFYLEGFNLSESWDSVESLSSEFDSDFEDAATNVINDYLVPLLSKGTALLIQDSGDFFPSLNVIIDVDGQEELADSIITDISSFLVDSVDDNVSITSSQKEMLGGDFTVLNIYIDEEKSSNPFAIYSDKDWRTIDLFMGVTDDSKFVISTNKNIEEEYGDNLINDDDFDIAFDENGGPVSYLSYLNFENISNWGQQVLSDWEDYDSSGLADFETAREAVKKFFSVFDSVYIISTQTNNNASAESDWRFDIDEIANIGEYGSTMFSALDQSFNTVNSSQTDFEDISDSEWYSEDVYYLASTGVVTGYYDGTFVPDNEITRAEFLTMLMRGLENKGYTNDLDWYCWDCDDFSDVDYYEWYGSYVYGAKDLGIIEGYDDGTFRPDNPITRAEAVTMISRVLDLAEISADFDTGNFTSFSDVADNDWFYGAVDTTRRYHIVEGVSATSFEPMRNINRAESAKIIRIALNIIS